MFKCHKIDVTMCLCVFDVVGCERARFTECQTKLLINCFLQLFRPESIIISASSV